MAGPEDVSAAAVVHARLAAQVDALDQQVVAIRDGDPEGVHQARIAARRLRSVLATFRPLFDREVAEPLREELRWFGLGLSDARDALVVRRRLNRLVAEEPFGLVSGPVPQRLQIGYDARAAATDAAVAATLASERRIALLDALHGLVADPPWTPAAERPAADALPARVRKDWKRLRRRYDASSDTEHPDEAMHDVRKAAKRFRYAAETLEPAFGSDASRLAKAAKRLTSVLGDRQDTVVSRRHLETLADEAEAAGESAFTYGRLHAREQSSAAELDRRFARVWERASRPKLRAWLR